MEGQARRGEGDDAGDRDGELTRRMAAIVESSSDAILGGTLDGVITFWNASATRILGYSADEVIGRKVTELVPADRVQEIASVLADLRQGKRIEPYDTQRCRKDGTLVDLSVSVSPVTSADGELVGAATVARDITEIKHAESYRRRLETRLQQAERMQAVGQLASGIAHDFGNLLGVIIGYAELAEDVAEGFDPELDRILAEIRQSAERGVVLTSDLVSFGRRTGRTPVPVDLNELISGLSDLLGIAMGGGAKVELSLSADRLVVLADRGRLEQVLLNLAVNARDAMPDGGTLTITTSHTELDLDHARRHPGLSTGRQVELAVTDTGTGMSPDVAARVFDRFFTTKPAETGAGLGLSTVQGIIADAGGSIEVDTAEGHGTTFRIYLPALPRPVG